MTAQPRDRVVHYTGLPKGFYIASVRENMYGSYTLMIQPDRGSCCLEKIGGDFDALSADLDAFIRGEKVDGLYSAAY